MASSKLHIKYASIVLDVPRVTSTPLTHCLSAPKGNHTPRRKVNNADDLSLPTCTVQQGGLITKTDIPLGWKPLNLEWYKWDNKSRRASGRLPDLGDPLH